MQRKGGKEWERLEISFKKIGAIKETFHARMGMIRDRKLKDLTEAEEIKKWQEYTVLVLSNPLCASTVVFGEQVLV